jgi:hypothetical protein
MAHFAFFFVALLAGPSLLLTTPSLAQTAPYSDAELLLAFKASLSNAGEVLANWTAGTSPCSGWKGVKCNGSGQVVSL